MIPKYHNPAMMIASVTLMILSVVQILCFMMRRFEIKIYLDYGV
jgi:hypothetical protein